MLEFNLNYFDLGGLITTLEEFEDCYLRIGFKNPHSYRGYYEQLAFEPIRQKQSVEDALAVIRPCLGSTFQGYKGGDFKMADYTECWFAEYGTSGGQQIGDMLLKLLVIDP